MSQWQPAEPQRVDGGAAPLVERSVSLARLPRQFFRDALARASSLIVVATSLTAILGFGYWVLAARVYPASEVGTAAVSVSVMTVASLLSLLGTSSAVVQRIPTRRAGAEWSLTVSASLAVAFFFGVLSGLICWVPLPYIIHVAALRSPTYGLALAAGVGLTNAGSVLDNIWVVERRTEVRLLTNTLMSTVKLPLLLLPVLHAEGAVGIQIGWTVAVLAADGTSLLLLARHRAFRPVVANLFAEVSAMRLTMFGNYMIGVGASIPTYVVPVIVGAIVSLTDTAYFYSAWRVGSFFFIGSLSVAAALFAEGSRAPSRATARARQALKVIVPLLLLATVALVFLAKPLLTAFGRSYGEHAALLLILLVTTTLPDALNSVYITILRIQRRYTQASAFVWGMALVQLGVSWILIHHIGILGAGFGWMAAELMGVLVQVVDRRWRSGAEFSTLSPRADGGGKGGVGTESSELYR